MEPCALVTTVGSDAVSSSIAQIVVVIETFINIKTDSTIKVIVAVTDIACAAESTAAHCVLGITTDSFHSVGLDFICAD